jgi:hypothetical protein
MSRARIVLDKCGMKPDLIAMIIDLVRENRMGAAWDLLRVKYPSYTDRVKLATKAKYEYEHTSHIPNDDTSVLIERCLTYFHTMLEV